MCPAPRQREVRAVPGALGWVNVQMDFPDPLGIQPAP